MKLKKIVLLEIETKIGEREIDKSQTKNKINIQIYVKNSLQEKIMSDREENFTMQKKKKTIFRMLQYASSRLGYERRRKFHSHSFFFRNLFFLKKLSYSKTVDE